MHLCMTLKDYLQVHGFACLVSINLGTVLI